MVASNSTAPGHSGVRVRHYEALSAMPPHCHEAASLNIVLAGDFLETIAGNERKYASGFIAFCPPGMAHSQCFGEWGARQIIFDAQADWLDYLVDCRLRLDDAPFSHAMLFHHLGHKLLREIDHPDDFAEIACESILLEIVAAFGRQCATLAVNPPAWLRATREYLVENAFSTITLRALARVAGRHEIHLAREFRRYYRVSIGTYLRTLRTDEAARLLLRRRSNISEIALTCGFASHAHLCREFKTRFGLTPSQYRRQAGPT